jgi:LmbE family N-acetylglucosaminyl deacetylase
MRVLAVGAHPGDVELGCGGALLAHRDRGDEIHVLVLAGPGSSPLGPDPCIAEQANAAQRLGAELHWGGFDDGCVPRGRESIAAIESLIVALSCDVVYGPSPDDTHQDHRAAGEATMAASRRSRQVLLYEGPSSVHFDPVVYVDLEGRVGAKLDLLGVHRSQLARNDLVDVSSVAARARYRGSQARVSHAEAFVSHRFVWELAPAPSSLVDESAPWGARSLLERKQQ